jgi:predicted MFS family arabinose efflux permease
MSAVSAGAAMAALLGGAVIDQINAGALGLVGAVPVLLALGIGVASRRVLLGAR